MNTIRTLSSWLMLTVLGWSIPALGQNRSAADAEQIANSFLSQPRSTSQRASSPMLLPQPTLQLYTTSSQLLDKGPVEPAFYVFTPQDKTEGGFVIVSGIEEAAPILGFSYTDVFDADQIPPAMRYLLGEYQAEIDAYRSIPAHEKLQRHYIEGGRQNLPVVGQGVSPLIQTRWNQSTPYNNLCPMDGNERSVTGCAATSTAQVMKYYEYPSHGTGSISYTTETKHIPVSFNFGSTTFQWSRMLDTYTSGSYTSSQATAVATLMAACGAAFKMDYQSSSSGASPSNQLTGLIDYLGYDADMALLFREFATTEQWHTLILDQLNARHPVIFSGQAEDGGHSFILDGYINDDPNNPSYHVNWGWGGYYDDYFKVSALDPEGQGIGGSSGGFNSDQNFLFGCFPENNKVDCGCFFLGETIGVTPVSVKPKTATEIEIKMENFYNYSYKTFSGIFRFYLKKGTKETYIGQTTDTDVVELFHGYLSYKARVTLPATLTEGTYEVVVKAKQSNSSIEEPIIWSSGNPTLLVSSSGGTEYAADLQTTAFELVSCSGRYIEATAAQVLNLAELSFVGTVKLALADADGKLLTTFGDGWSIDGLDQYYNFRNPHKFTGYIPESYCVDGHYRLYAAANQTGYTGWSYLRGYSIEHRSDGDYISDYNRDCYIDLWISGGVVRGSSFAVTTSSSAGGRVEASADFVEMNGEVTFTIIPDDGYVLSKAKLNGKDVTSQVVNLQYTAKNVQEDLRFEATFAQAPEYYANLQLTGFNVLSRSGRTLSVELVQIANFADESFTGVISLALADNYNNVLTIFGERTQINDLGRYRYLTNPRTITSTIPQEVGNGHYRLCAVAKQDGKSGWSLVKRFEMEDNTITARSLDCYQDIWLVNGVLGIVEVVSDDNQKAVTYDLWGLQVHDLVPGNVYIRNGKKFRYSGE